jgi:hypothetical protein
VEKKRADFINGYGAASATGPKSGRQRARQVNKTRSKYAHKIDSALSLLKPSLDETTE